MTHAVPALLCIVALAYGVRTISRNRDWRSDESLYRSVIETQGRHEPDPRQPRLDRFRSGRFRIGRARLAGCARIGPDEYHALDDMALLRQMQQRYHESIDYSTKSLRFVLTTPLAMSILARDAGRGGTRRRGRMAIPRRHRALSALDERSQQLRQISARPGPFRGCARRIRTLRGRRFQCGRVRPAGRYLSRLAGFSARRKSVSPRPQRQSFDSHAHFGLGKVLESTSRPGDALANMKVDLPWTLPMPTPKPQPIASSRAPLRKPGLTEPIRQRVRVSPQSASSCCCGITAFGQESCLVYVAPAFRRALCNHGRCPPEGGRYKIVPS